MYWVEENVIYRVSRIIGKIENTVSGYTFVILEACSRINARFLLEGLENIRYRTFWT